MRGALENSLRTCRLARRTTTCKSRAETAWGTSVLTLSTFLAEATLKTQLKTYHHVPVLARIDGEEVDIASCIEAGRLPSTCLSTGIEPKKGPELQQEPRLGDRREIISDCLQQRYGRYLANLPSPHFFPTISSLKYIPPTSHAQWHAELTARQSGI